MTSGLCFRQLVLGAILLAFVSLSAGQLQAEEDAGGGLRCVITDYGAVAEADALCTGALQRAIDACAKRGGGTVVIPPGTFRSGHVELKSHVTLHLQKGAVLQGSDDYRDYGEGGWYEALLTGTELEGVRIEGEGTIDGVDCVNPQGEEGFRGPHGIYLNKCRDIVIRGITIRRTGNYAIICRECTGATIESTAIRGGHDAVNVWDSSKFVIRDCDFRTGDDCIAGCNNHDFLIEDCRLNSSCNLFRFSCIDLIVRDCRFWGPGEFPHRVRQRRAIPNAFTHFSPGEGKSSEPISDNWLVENITVDFVGHFYRYDYEKGGWQTKRPVKKVRFRNVEAKRLRAPFLVIGDGQGEFILENVTLGYDSSPTEFKARTDGDRRDWETFRVSSGDEPYAFDVRKAARLEMRNVTITCQGDVSQSVFRWEDVQEREFEDVIYQPAPDHGPTELQE